VSRRGLADPVDLLDAEYEVSMLKYRSNQLSGPTRRRAQRAAHGLDKESDKNTDSRLRDNLKRNERRWRAKAARTFREPQQATPLHAVNERTCTVTLGEAQQAAPVRAVDKRTRTVTLGEAQQAAPVRAVNERTRTMTLGEAEQATPERAVNEQTRTVRNFMDQATLTPKVFNQYGLIAYSMTDNDTSHPCPTCGDVLRSRRLYRNHLLVKHRQVSRRGLADPVDLLDAQYEVSMQKFRSNQVNGPERRRAQRAANGLDKESDTNTDRRLRDNLKRNERRWRAKAARTFGEAQQATPVHAVNERTCTVTLGETEQATPVRAVNERTRTMTLGEAQQATPVRAVNEGTRTMTLGEAQQATPKHALNERTRTMTLREAQQTTPVRAVNERTRTMTFGEAQQASPVRVVNEPTRAVQDFMEQATRVPTFHIIGLLLRIDNSWPGANNLTATPYSNLPRDDELTAALNEYCRPKPPNSSVQESRPQLIEPVGLQSCRSSSSRDPPGRSIRVGQSQVG